MCPPDQVRTSAALPLASQREELSIAGVRPGMARAEVEALLGPGRRLQDPDSTRTVYGDYQRFYWEESQRRWVEVEWTGEGCVRCVEGSHLYWRGRELLARGVTLEAAVQVLGPCDDPVAVPPGMALIVKYTPRLAGSVHSWRQSRLEVEVTERLVIFRLREPR